MNEQDRIKDVIKSLEDHIEWLDENIKYAEDHKESKKQGIQFAIDLLKIQLR